MLPEPMSVMAWTVLAYGTWVSFSPFIVLNLSMHRCPEPQLPADPYRSSPGRALAYAIHSEMFFAGMLGPTMIANGVVPTRATAPRSVASRYLWFISVEINWVMVDRNIVWPSGAALAMSSAAINPVAPGRLSTMIGWLQDSASLLARSRPITSGALPAPLAMIMRTGRCG